jgi:hypothetical protein
LSRAKGIEQGSGRCIASRCEGASRCAVANVRGASRVRDPCAPSNPVTPRGGAHRERYARGADTSFFQRGGYQRLSVAMSGARLWSQVVLSPETKGVNINCPLFPPLPARAIVHRTDPIAQAHPLHDASSLRSCCEFFSLTYEDFSPPKCWQGLNLHPPFFRCD